MRALLLLMFGWGFGGGHEAGTHEGGRGNGILELRTRLATNHPLIPIRQLLVNIPHTKTV